MEGYYYIAAPIGEGGPRPSPNGVTDFNGPYGGPHYPWSGGGGGLGEVDGEHGRIGGWRNGDIDI